MGQAIAESMGVINCPRALKDGPKVHPDRFWIAQEEVKRTLTKKRPSEILLKMIFD